MKHCFTVILATLSMSFLAQSDFYPPYNPDSNEDGYIYLVDLLDLLSVFGMEYSPDEFVTDSTSAILNLGVLKYTDCLAAIHNLESNWTLMPDKAVGIYSSELSEIAISNSKIHAWCNPRFNYFRESGNDLYEMPIISLQTFQIGSNSYSEGQHGSDIGVSENSCIAYIEALEPNFLQNIVSEFEYVRVNDTETVYGNINVSETIEGHQLFTYPMMDTVLTRASNGWVVVDQDKLDFSYRNWYSNGGSSSMKVYLYLVTFAKYQ